MAAYINYAGFIAVWAVIGRGLMPVKLSSCDQQTRARPSFKRGDRWDGRHRAAVIFARSDGHFRTAACFSSLSLTYFGNGRFETGFDPRSTLSPPPPIISKRLKLLIQPDFNFSNFSNFPSFQIIYEFSLNEIDDRVDRRNLVFFLKEFLEKIRSNTLSIKFPLVE